MHCTLEMSYSIFHLSLYGDDVTMNQSEGLSLASKLIQISSSVILRIGVFFSHW
uniref:Uncharacterized protein n=1 Tax=Lepeophtheirus salmonis TaxID=72036 RepID=A0A0K2UKS4_LEPSM